ncbi:motile sperm domain-containing protein 2-like [Panonychus citri]|uniref:motile sperm domain-containing protein 2-like n=1 Tax=Panonychus citri TaxID=50023 RepID=UPI00230762EB|nr:motile sperm domain-containing protein 2-like [Panonychus citri]
MTEIIASNFQSNITRLTREEEEVNQAIDSLRELCLQEIATNGHLYDPNDAKIIRGGQRMSMISYLESHSWNIHDSFESVKAHCRWRKENSLCDLKATSFPRELHIHGMFHPYGYDKLGHPLLFIRLSTQTGPRELNSLVLQHFIWVAETMRDRVIESDKRFALIYDCRNPSVDIRLIKEILTIYTQHYPLSLAWVAFIEMTTSFRLMYHVIKFFFPKYIRNQMMSIDRSGLRELVDEDNIPTYLGGNSVGMDSCELENCPTTEQFVQSAGYSKELTAKTIKHFQQFQR